MLIRLIELHAYLESCFRKMFSSLYDIYSLAKKKELHANNNKKK